MRQITCLIILCLLMVAPAHAEILTKNIAPDITIESFETGEFLTEPADPLKFRATDVCTREHFFGWRMKVRTTRDSLFVQEGSSGGGRRAVAHKAKRHKGYFYGAGLITDGVPGGTLHVILYVENKPAVSYERRIVSLPTPAIIRRAHQAR